MKISLQNQKGGVGKTTLAIHISYALSLGSNRVLLIDADPQGSALDWAAARSQPPPLNVIGLSRPTIHRDMKELSKGYDYVVIDSPPRVTELARSAIIASDLVIIPIQPSPYDVWAAQETVNLIKEASVYKENLKSVFTINRKIVNTAIGRGVVEALADFEIPILHNHICQRVIYAESAATGSTVFESRNDAAIKEMNLLMKEVEEVLNSEC